MTNDRDNGYHNWTLTIADTPTLCDAAGCVSLPAEQESPMTVGGVLAALAVALLARRAQQH